MSFKTSLVKTAIKWTPNKLVSCVANIILKDIAELKGFDFNLETRKSYMQVQLVGESETIEVWFEGFAIIHIDDSYKFVVEQARSNRIWLNNILSRIETKEWKIPVTAKTEVYIAFAAELLAAENTTVDE